MDQNSYQPASATLTPDDILNRDILELMGVTDMPQVDKDKLYDKMVDTIHTRVVARIDDQLSDTDAEEMKQVLETKDSDKFSQFLSSHQIDIKKLYGEELLMYKIEMTELAKLLDKGKDQAHE